ncbi:MAG: RNA 3'-terminal phosphate cyclase [Candidatus Bathyarchaeota archaeon]|nr:RNA 3'-terminal phosphate cyclase [Candidatus Bathyarchaeota archaeon]MDH5733082.1 RNA 3'-terminal phosphate cyclase [Candidatus Bathyarchaeota archaeon]
MLNIDGSQKSGSGTILRLSIALAGILQEPLHLYNIRQKRTKPGLRPQHLEAVLTAAKLCNAETEGAKLNSKELWFHPQQINGGEIHAEIGTAGSIPMLLLTILPICAYARNTVRIRIVKGGTDVRHSPTINYLKHVLLEVLDQIGLKTSLNIHKYGYYPKGMGEVFMKVQPCQKLKPLALEKSGELENLEGVSVCTFLEERKVAERQARAANRYLEDYGLEAEIRVVNDKSNPLQKGSSLVLWGKTDTGALLGGDAIGELRKPSEAVGREAAENLFKEIETGATVDVHLADMLVPYVALADDYSTYLTRNITEHLETNLWLTEKILGVRFEVRRIKELYQIKKKGL